MKRGRKKGKKKSRRSRIRKRINKGVKSQWGKISSGISVLVFFSQLTQKDREAGIYDGKSMGDKAKQFGNNILGRIIGLNPFSDQVKFEQTINIDGAFNKYTGLGLAGYLYSLIPIKGLPHKGKAKSLGKKIALAGILGGIFDAPGDAQVVNNKISNAPSGIVNRTSHVSSYSPRMVTVSTI